jgi:hypothetical protein
LGSITRIFTQPRFQWAAGFVIVAGLIALNIALLLGGSGAQPAAPSAKPLPQVTLAPPKVKQASWEFKAFPVGPAQHMTKKDKARAKAQRIRIKRIVTRVFDSMLVRPGELSGVIKSTFTQPAARAFNHSKMGLPKGTDSVQILARRGEIGIDALRARRAGVEVLLRARGVADGAKFDIESHCSLWLERSKGSWRVIGFDVQQGPITRVAAKDRDTSKAGGKQDGDRAGKRDRRRDRVGDGRRDRKRRNRRG